MAARESLPPPTCEWLPRPDRVIANYGDVMHDVAVNTTVEYWYREEIDTTLPMSGLVTAREGLYERALAEHGFERARGLELGLLLNLAAACEARPGGWCADCPLAHNYGYIDGRLDELSQQAAAEGYAGDDFESLVARMRRHAQETYEMIISTLDV